MKPPPFEYHDPTTVEEALELLARYGEDARVLAGGQSLIPLLNFRLTAPAVLVDLNRVGELSYMREDGGWLRIGAMTRQRQVEFSALAGEKLPLMVEATRLIGHLPTRTRGTVGGSIAHADPSAEYPALACALEGQMAVRGRAGERVIGAADFFQGLLGTALKPGELLAEVRMPTTPARSGWAFEEFARRHGDFAIAGVGAQLTLRADGKCASARAAAFGVGPTPVKLRAVEQALEGSALSEAQIDAASALASELVNPTSDLHASAAYRRHLTQVLVKRALTRAVAAARQTLH
jgi:carbon-monoxide dehydrogenase medium subunit